MIFTTDAVIKDKGWVLLEDDKVLQPADNVTPVLNNKITDAYGSQLTSLVNAVTAKITTEGLTELNKQTGIDKKDSDDVAKQWLDDNGFKVVKRAAKTGPTITVGSGGLRREQHARQHLRRLAPAQRISGQEEAQHREPRDLLPGC